MPSVSAVVFCQYCSAVCCLTKASGGLLAFGSISSLSISVRVHVALVVALCVSAMALSETLMSRIVVENLNVGSNIVHKIKRKMLQNRVGSVVKSNWLIVTVAV